MNTVEKGDAFEDRVYNAIIGLLKNDGLGLAPRYCKLYRKKPYYSRDRGAAIVMDISIELWPPKAERYSLLWVCECKDYTGALPVNDVEEFDAKLRQIGGVNVKGMLALSGAMQRAAFTYALARGIAVVRVLPADQVKWVMHCLTILSTHREGGTYESISAFLDPHHEGKNRSFYGIYNNHLSDGWKDIAGHMLSE